ncbi:MAG: hypothetical protein KA802_14560 [Saprospiraceae bacterium]|nr:hypothetical protein [Saprospiraceae bacterium]
MGAILKILAILIVTGGSSYGYFSSHRGNIVEKSEVQEIQQEIVNETVETALIESSDENASSSVQEVEKKVAAEVIVSETTPPKADDKKKEKKKEKDTKKDEDEDEKTSDDRVMPKPCFGISGNKYSENIYYFGTLKFNAECSKDSVEYQWYVNGNSLGVGKTYNFSYKDPNISKRLKINVKNPIEIKLIATSRDGLVSSETKTVSFREVPKIDICFNLESSKMKNFKLGEEYAFDASCSTFSDENPITKYTWKFRDGGLDDSVEKEGIKVSHTFSKPTTTSSSSGCSDGMLSVDLIIATKLSPGSSYGYSYCIEK